MNLKNQLYMMRKRLPEKTLLSIKKIIEEEIDRRLKNDYNTSVTK